MTTTDMGRGRRRVHFAPNSQDPSSLDVAVHVQGSAVDMEQRMYPLVTIVRFPTGLSRTIDLSNEPCSRFCRELLRALVELTEVTGPINRPGTLGAYAGCIRDLVRFLAKVYPQRDDIITATDLTRHDIDAFEAHLRTRFRSDSNTSYHAMCRIRILLRQIESDTPGILSRDVDERLTFAATGSIGRYYPRDAYSLYVAEQLRSACQKEMADVIKRITVTGEERLSAGRDPDIYGWDDRDNKLWAIAHQGVIDYRTSWYKRGRQALGDLHRMLYPTSRDLVPFIVMLALNTDLPIESCKELKIDCLKNETKGYVEIPYIKTRDSKQPWKTTRVRDGSLTTPGGIIRAVQRITRRARQHLQSDSLWPCYSTGQLRQARFGARGKIHAKYHPTSQFVAAHNIVDDNGKPLQLDLSRLRKTRRSERYVATKGQLSEFAIGVHSTTVAGDHYGDIPALRHMHEATIENALNDALQEAIAITVISPEEEADLRLQPDVAAMQLGIEPERVEALLNGKSEVFLADCKNFFNSPFGKKGSACPTPFWACFDCVNAVITLRTLPNNIMFLNFIIAQRERMDQEEWRAKFGRPYDRIIWQILPKFSDEDKRAAKAIAEANQDLLYLPPELTMIGHAGL